MYISSGGNAQITTEENAPNHRLEGNGALGGVRSGCVPPYGELVIRKKEGNKKWVQKAT